MLSSGMSRRSTTLKQLTLHIFQYSCRLRDISVGSVDANAHGIRPNGKDERILASGVFRVGKRYRRKIYFSAFPSFLLILTNEYVHGIRPKPQEERTLTSGMRKTAGRYSSLAFCTQPSLLLDLYTNPALSQFVNIGEDIQRIQL